MQCRCIHCLVPVDTTHVLYEDPKNTSLSFCKECNEPVDEYICKPFSLVVLDLLLQRRPVYYHLVFNRDHARERAVKHALRNGRKIRAREDHSLPHTVFVRALATYSLYQVACALVIVDPTQATLLTRDAAFACAESIALTVVRNVFFDALLYAFCVVRRRVMGRAFHRYDFLNAHNVFVSLAYARVLPLFLTVIYIVWRTEYTAFEVAMPRMLHMSVLVAVLNTCSVATAMGAVLQEPPSKALALMLGLSSYMCMAA